MPTVALLGTMDTKGSEYAWLRDKVQALGCEALTVDCGIFEPAIAADVSALDHAKAANFSLEDLRSAEDRGAAMTAMTRGAGEILSKLQQEGKIQAVLAVGGSGGSSLASGAMQALPIGFPKVLVSTMASGDVGPYVGACDLTLMYSVVDIAGINMISRKVLGNAAAAVCGMAQQSTSEDVHKDSERPIIAATMFGVTTAGVAAAREHLESLGYDVVVFHATGSGGRSMERLIETGFFCGVLDLTTTELADELVGGVLTAGPRRLEAAGKSGVPQVVSVGALDMVNFGPRSTVPEKFEGRNLHVHNDTITLMRTTREEMRELGRMLGEKLAAADGPSTLFLPLKGVSAIDVDGAPFRDEQADLALFEALRETLSGTKVRLIERESAINDPEFAIAVANELHRLIAAQTQR